LNVGAVNANGERIIPGLKRVQASPGVPPELTPRSRCIAHNGGSFDRLAGVHVAEADYLEAVARMEVRGVVLSALAHSHDQDPVLTMARSSPEPSHFFQDLTLSMT